MAARAYRESCVRRREELSVYDANESWPRLASILDFYFHGASGIAQLPDHVDELAGYVPRASRNKGEVLDYDQVGNFNFVYVACGDAVPHGIKISPVPIRSSHGLEERIVDVIGDTPIRAV